jgi:hypothetical protein
VVFQKAGESIREDILDALEVTDSERHVRKVFVPVGQGRVESFLTEHVGEGAVVSEEVERTTLEEILKFLKSKKDRKEFTLHSGVITLGGVEAFGVKGNVVCFAIDFLVKDTSAAVLAGISSKAERLIPLGVGELRVLGEDVFEALE